MDYNKLATEIYEQNKAVGWWDNPDRCLYECLQLVSTEVAEATEAERKDLYDDHLPDRKGGEVELADALIRVLDLGGRMGWTYETGAQPRPDYSGQAPARLHLHINEGVVLLAQNLNHELAARVYSALVDRVVWVAGILGYDIEGATVEKLAYNKTRADHKRENRAKDGGKKF